VPTARERPPEEASIDTSFARGLRLLLMVADRGEVRADELATVLEMPLSTVYRYVRTLAEFGFVERHDGRYRLGPGLRIGSGPVVTSEQLIRASDAVLHQLAADSGETAVVMRRIGLTAARLHQVEAGQALRVTLDPDAQVPLSTGAFGLVLLAFAPDDIVDEVLSAEALGEDTMTADDGDDARSRRLHAELRKVARAGVASSLDLPIEGALAVAVPILRPDGIVGAVGLIGPAFRCDDAWLARVRRRLPAAARRIAAELAGGEVSG
jgi:DNA-binding IclR family transcriptional regulator